MSGSGSTSFKPKNKYEIRYAIVIILKILKIAVWRNALLFPIGLRDLKVCDMSFSFAASGILSNTI